jgi:NAD+ synthase (glutamine-hydrolysing)
LQQGFLEACSTSLQTIILATEGIAAIVGLPRLIRNGRLANSAAVIENGSLLGYEDKRLFPTYDVFDEARYFSRTEREEKLWRIAGKKIAITICEDIWGNSPEELLFAAYESNPVEELAKLKPDILCIRLLFLASETIFISKNSKKRALGSLAESIPQSLQLLP